MTICTQNFQIAYVDLPVLDAARPAIACLRRPHFSGRINVVKLKNSNVGVATRGTRAAKAADKIAFKLPIACLPSPVACGFFAGVRAIARFTRIVAFKAASFAPSACHVAGSGAIGRIRKTSARWLNIKRLSTGCAKAIFAGLFPIWRQANFAFVPSWRAHLLRAFLGTEFAACTAYKRGGAIQAFVMDGFHAVIIKRLNALSIYFDIACKRIRDEYARPRLALEPAPQPVQEGFEL